MTYKLLEEIGHGGMGCVYKGLDAQGCVVAIKMMSNKVTCYSEYRNLFRSEVETLKRMDNPNVVHIVGDPYGDEEGNLYLPMEYVEGKTLEQCVYENGLFSFEKTISIMCDILDAIQYVHDRGRIHRDIKPSNIMYRPDGSICIIDFGIAKDARIGTGQTVGRIIGTDGYMSPEQANGLNIDHRTDIYSLGCVFYFLLTGKHAIAKGNNDYETVCNILKSIPSMPSESVPGVPQEIDNVFVKAVNKNMTLRYQSANEFREALQTVIGISCPKVQIGRSSGNDIIINNIDVSRKHLIITCKENRLKEIECIEITDISTNGTGVNGRFLHHNSITIPFSNEKNLPEVLLAGKPNLLVDWNEVISILRSRKHVTENDIKVNYDNPCSGNNITSSDISNTTNNSGIILKWFLIVLSFLIPLLGLIICIIYHFKDNSKDKEKVIAKATISGFIVNYILYLFL